MAFHYRMQPVLLPDVPRTTGLQAKVLNTHASIGSFFACTRAYLSEIVRLYFMQRTSMRVLGVKYDGTFFHRSIKSRVHHLMHLA